ncbi:MAG: hypothetical protein H6Q90_1761 [Deltaproteobacteria bacterium]|nr:hypothetical protein [Deltaproteobacteria bacterium]
MGDSARLIRRKSRLAPDCAGLPVARAVLGTQGMKTHGKDPNQGEGDKMSARHYGRSVREFIAEGKVDDAARNAKAYVERSPDLAERAERRARKGPRGTRVSVDELIARSRSAVDRVMAMLERATSKLRSRPHRSK